MGYGDPVSDYEVCGCHVLVGVADPDTAVSGVNHLGRWLPVLPALSANSPFDHGRDTSYHSWRMVLQSRFPESGVVAYSAAAPSTGPRWTSWSTAVRSSTTTSPSGRSGSHRGAPSNADRRRLIHRGRFAVAGPAVPRPHPHRTGRP
ncbi:glutamate-cysteine ligase family protein [Amycolatopsis sp. NPDC051372]|uniref:glutamate-cysteine ligase family protein n=1 Tax=unclassified Amycolatopsis TaxID=2618356 RepID=UPI00342D0CFF